MGGRLGLSLQGSCSSCRIIKARRGIVSSCAPVAEVRCAGAVLCECVCSCCVSGVCSCPQHDCTLPCRRCRVWPSPPCSDDIGVCLEESPGKSGRHHPS